METFSIYLSIVFLVSCSFAQNEKYGERLEVMERNMYEMNVKAETKEAELRAEIEELRGQAENSAENYRLLQLQLRAAEKYQRREYEKVLKKLEGCTDVTRLNNDVKKRQMETMQNEVAFFAKLGQDMTHLGMNQIVVFDDVVTNIDGTNSPVAYNRHTGVFTVPVNGIYVFSTSIVSSLKSTSHFRFFVNNLPITVMYVHGNTYSGYDSASQTVVLSLKRGDAVSVRNSENDQGALGGGHSVFSGFLLRQHGEDMIVG